LKLAHFFFPTHEGKIGSFKNEKYFDFPKMDKNKCPKIGK
jgi:hypothetical protein